MIVSHRHRFIFVHNNRTGGTSVGDALVALTGPEDLVIGYGDDGIQRELIEQAKGPAGLQKHLSASEIKRRLPECAGYFTFAVVRNPWDRAYSSWQFWKQLAGDYMPEIRSQVAPMSFPQFIASPVYLEWEPTNWHMVANPDGGLAVDFVARFERLVEDFAHICRHVFGADVKLPKHNATQRGDFRAAFTEDAMVRVAAKCRDDIVRLDYRFV